MTLARSSKKSFLIIISSLETSNYLQNIPTWLYHSTSSSTSPKLVLHSKFQSQSLVLAEQPSSPSYPASFLFLFLSISPPDLVCISHITSLFSSQLPCCSSSPGPYHIPSEGSKPPSPSPTPSLTVHNPSSTQLSDYHTQVSRPPLPSLKLPTGCF